MMIMTENFFSVISTIFSLPVTNNTTTKKLKETDDTKNTNPDEFVVIGRSKPIIFVSVRVKTEIRNNFSR